MDYYNATTVDEINYTNVWITIDGKQWIEIGNHTNGSTFNWNTTSLAEQTCIDLRCRAIDLAGSNTYSDYYTKGCCLNISHLDLTPPASISNLQNSTGNFWINWTWDNPPDGCIT